APPDESPEVAIAADSGKLYLVKGALLEVRDTLTGRMLGDWAVPGLDESVAWQVSPGAGRAGGGAVVWCVCTSCPPSGGEFAATSNRGSPRRSGVAPHLP